MCDLADVEEEVQPGSLWVLCGEFEKCLAKELAASLGHVPDHFLKSLEAPFRAFAPATMAIFEWYYFDLDYRSEFSVAHETAFAIRDPETVRVHFFGLDTNERSFRGVAEEAAARSVARADGYQDAYKGYVIVRPQVPGVVGRSVITPRGRLPVVTGGPDLKEGEPLFKHVRTAVTEQTDLYGVSLSATGVPFMEQDGALLRCAHVSAWMCHYTAVLRGVVVRRPSAQFHLAEDPSGTYGRQYPSVGLSAFSLSNLLRRLDLPPEILDQQQLGASRTPRWYDRAVVWSASDLKDARRRRFWMSKNLTTNVCRYLNSGFPCILTRDDLREQPGHTQVICGYLRAEDLTPECRPEVSPEPDGTDSLHSEVVALIVHDDQDGPYRAVWVNELVEVLMGNVPGKSDASISVLTPLPKGLWLSGSVAEESGAAIFAKCVARREEALAAWSQSVQLNDEQAGENRAALRRVAEWVQAQGDGNLAVRTYAMLGSDFKVGFARVDDPVARRIVGYTNMPRYVWVTEVIDRTLRQTDPPVPPVLGTVVMDASMVLDVVSMEGGAPPLLVHIPGQISMIQDPPFDDEHWFPTSVKPYFSGRWHHDREWLQSAERTAARFKGSVPG